MIKPCSMATATMDGSRSVSSKRSPSVLSNISWTLFLTLSCVWPMSDTLSITETVLQSSIWFMFTGDSLKTELADIDTETGFPTSGTAREETSNAFGFNVVMWWAETGIRTQAARHKSIRRPASEATPKDVDLRRRLHVFPTPVFLRVSALMVHKASNFKISRASSKSCNTRYNWDPYECVSARLNLDRYLKPYSVFKKTYWMFVGNNFVETCAKSKYLPIVCSKFARIGHPGNKSESLALKNNKILMYFS